MRGGRAGGSIGVSDVLGAARATCPRHPEAGRGPAWVFSWSREFQIALLASTCHSSPSLSLLSLRRRRCLPSLRSRMSWPSVREAQGGLLQGLLLSQGRCLGCKGDCVV